MRDIIEGPPEPGAPPPPLWKRLAWFVGLALAASAVTALTAYAMKALLPDYPGG
ncbi:hypothetical protein [Phenylobacterium sp.]|uniref:hypothetical protein n=1 Tax=Phenylobacterium sp. TaxID=1871053 RepID=UPI00289B418B|nr:hypothetical protein [Phenylobacterium sp.]